jgi:hypothetical protein
MLMAAILSIAIVLDPAVVVIRTDDGTPPRAVVREDETIVRTNTPKAKRSLRDRRVVCDSIVRVMVVGRDGKVATKLVTVRRR